MLKLPRNRAMKRLKVVFDYLIYPITEESLMPHASCSCIFLSRGTESYIVLAFCFRIFVEKYIEHRSKDF